MNRYLNANTLTSKTSDTENKIKVINLIETKNMYLISAKKINDNSSIGELKINDIETKYVIRKNAKYIVRSGSVVVVGSVVECGHSYIHKYSV